MHFPFEFCRDGDLWQRVVTAVELRGKHSVLIFKVEVRATGADIEAGRSTQTLAAGSAHAHAAMQDVTPCGECRG